MKCKNHGHSPWKYGRTAKGSEHPTLIRSTNLTHLHRRRSAGRPTDVPSQASGVDVNHSYRVNDLAQEAGSAMVLWGVVPVCSDRFSGQAEAPDAPTPEDEGPIPPEVGDFQFAG
jgi:hypothetical protein